MKLKPLLDSLANSAATMLVVMLAMFAFLAIFVISLWSLMIYLNPGVRI